MTLKNSILISLLFISGCHYLIIGDGMFIVNGEIVNNSNKCFIYLYSQNREKVIEKRKIENTFSEDFVIAPYKSTYDVAITCDELELISKTIIYGKDIKPGENLNFGKISL